MAGEDVLANVTNSLSQLFQPDIAVLFNRKASTGAAIPSLRGRGKNVAWDVLSNGAELPDSQVMSYLEGADVVWSTDAGVDQPLPATLNWAHYRRNFWVSETEFDAAATSSDSAEALISLFETRVMGCATALASGINKDLLLGTGTDANSNVSITGLLGGALISSGSYAGLSLSSYPLFGSNILSNGGVNRSLSLDLMEQIEENIWVASGEVPNLWIVSPGVWRKYIGLFEPLRRIEGTGPIPRYDSSTSMLFFKGVPIIRDKDLIAYEGTNGGVAIAVNTNYVKKVFLPSSPMSAEDVFKVEEREGEGSNWKGSNDKLALPFRIVPMARTGDSLKFMVKCVLNLEVSVPNTMGYINNISI